MSETEFEHFSAWALSHRTKHKLHPAVEGELARLLVQEFPDTVPVAEVGAVKGGRNDLLLYRHDGRKAVFELFFSPSQVSQDLRLLEQCEADWKIAVLMDLELRPTLAPAYFRKRPDTFPYLWLSQIMMPSKLAEGRKLLRKHLSEPLPPPHSSNRVTQTVTGNHNHTAAGDIIVTQKHVTRPKIVRVADDITEATAHEISELVRRINETDELAGKVVRHGLWMGKLKRKFKVESYRKLTHAQGEEAIVWLKQQLGRGAPSLRRTNNPEWRRRINTAIYAVVGTLAWEKPQLYQFATEFLKLSKPINSLNDLGERDLEKLRNKLRRMIAPTRRRTAK